MLATEMGSSPSGRGFHPPTSRSARVVSLHLDGFLRTRAAGLLHPAPGPGVRRVSVEPSHHRTKPKPGAPWVGSSFPRRGHPSKGFPRPQPYRITAASCPRAVAFSRSGEGTGSGRLQGLALLTSPWRRTAVSSDGSLAPPMGFCPLRGPLGAPVRLLSLAVRERTAREWRTAHRGEAAAVGRVVGGGDSPGDVPEGPSPDQTAAGSLQRFSAPTGLPEGGPVRATARSPRAPHEAAPARSLQSLSGSRGRFPRGRSAVAGARGPVPRGCRPPWGS